MITKQIDTYFGQTKGCIAVLQVGMTRWLWSCKWSQKRQSALVSIEIDSPKHRLAFHVGRVGFRLRAICPPGYSYPAKFVD